MTTSRFSSKWPDSATALTKPKESRTFNKASTRYPASTPTIGVGRHASPSDAARSPTTVNCERFAFAALATLNVNGPPHVVGVTEVSQILAEPVLALA